MAWSAVVRRDGDSGACGGANGEVVSSTEPGREGKEVGIGLGGRARFMRVRRKQNGRPGWLIGKAGIRARAAGGPRPAAPVTAWRSGSAWTAGQTWHAHSSALARACGAHHVALVPAAGQHAWRWQRQGRQRGSAQAGHAREAKRRGRQQGSVATTVGRAPTCALRQGGSSSCGAAASLRLCRTVWRGE